MELVPALAQLQLLRHQLNLRISRMPSRTSGKLNSLLTYSIFQLAQLFGNILSFSLLGLIGEVEEHIAVLATVMYIVYTKIIHHLMMKITHGMEIQLSRCKDISTAVSLSNQNFIIHNVDMGLSINCMLSDQGRVGAVELGVGKRHE